MGGAFERPPVFIFAGITPGISRHCPNCPTQGGAMTEKKEEAKESGEAGALSSSTMAPKRPDPEKGLVGVKSWVRDWVVKVIFDNLEAGMTVLGQRIQTGDVAILKFVMELLDRFEDVKEDPQLVLQSFAEFLMTELDGMPAETGDKAGAEASASA
jgi:hypothetical protein